MKTSSLLIIFNLFLALNNPLHAVAPKQEILASEHKKEKGFIKKHKKLSAAIAAASLVLVAGLCTIVAKNKKRKKLYIELPHMHEPHLSKEEQENRATIHEYASTYAQDAGLIKPQNKIKHERTLSYLKDRGLVLSAKDKTLSVNGTLLESLKREAEDSSWLWNNTSSAEAQYNLGIYYYHIQDYLASAYWFEKAAENNYFDAYPYLAELYLYHGNKGIIPPDKQTPIAILKHATFNKKNAQAKLLLAQVIIFGPTVYHHDEQDAPQNVEYGFSLLDEIIEEQNVHESYVDEAKHLRDYLRDGLYSVLPRSAEGQKEFKVLLATSQINEQSLKKEPSVENIAQQGNVVEQQSKPSPKKQDTSSSVGSLRKVFEKPKEEPSPAPQKKPSRNNEQELQEVSSHWRKSTTFSTLVTPELQQQLNEEREKAIQKRIKPLSSEQAQEQPPVNIVQARKAEIEQKTQEHKDSQPQLKATPEPELPFEVTWFP